VTYQFSCNQLGGALKRLIIAVLLALTLAACGMGGRIVNGKWVDDGRGGQVWCIGADDGGITCDWERSRKAGQ
jgi:hypothetical protein